MNEPGFAAKFESLCPRCGEPIARGDRVVRTRRDVIHVRCASGYSDEE